MALARVEPAPAKINLTLRVVARRPDGYHDIESLVAFAGVADQLSFTSGRALALSVSGPTAARSGDVADNLVLKAAHALAERVDGLKVGLFHLSKRLPVAAGLGGGSSDAAAALRLLARANRLALHDPRLLAANDGTGLRWSYDPDGCCAIRKVEPLQRALAPFDAWISGRKGFQAGTRTALPMFELDP